MKPRVYCVSKLRHAPMWREWGRELRPIKIVSTWHDNLNVEWDENDLAACLDGWRLNRMQILHKTDHLLVFGDMDEKLNGCLVEVGMAIAMGLQVHLVGTFPWGTWRLLDGVHVHATLHDAVVKITGAVIDYDPISAVHRSNPHDQT